MKDYGCDPLPDGRFRMVPSGDVVSAEEKDARLPKMPRESNDCLGMSWETLARKQGGLSTLDITRKRWIASDQAQLRSEDD